MESTKNRLRLKLMKRAAEAEQNKNAKTSPLETAKAVEPTAIPSSDEVSTTVPGTRLVVAHPDDPVSLKIQRRPSKELAAKKTISIISISMDNDFTVETVLQIHFRLQTLQRSQVRSAD
jgi:hypothetical protein